MKKYLLGIYQPDGPPPPPEMLEPVMREVFAVGAEMKAAGAWIDSSGLQPAAEAKVLRVRGGKPLTTDGPFVEAREHLGGFVLIQAPDLDAALEWGRKMARATTLPIEVRELQGHGGAPPQG